MIMTPSQQPHYLNTDNPTTSLSPPNSPLISAPSTLTSHFVQALHDYLPSSVNTEESVSCLFFKKGSIIEVFNRDDSGWWDGQCGDVRGWFPSNYVGRIGELKRQSADFEDDDSNDELESWHQRLNQHINNTSTVSLEEYSTKISTIQTRVEMAKTLLRDDKQKSEPISVAAQEIHFLVEEVTKRVTELVQVCSHPSQQHAIQFHIFQTVSSVRSVLSEANIVNKESILLRMYPELARQRKIVLNALSRLVLKGKELQQPDHTEEPDEEKMPYFADQLLNEMEMFESLLRVIPRQSTDSAYSINRPPSLFQFDTPRSSVSSLGHSSVHSTNSAMRQLITEARHSNHSSSSLTKHFLSMDREHILQNILDHQACIDGLMGSLVIALERYLVSRHRATEMLETTRKAVEAVRTFLAVVEHVCSNLGELDNNRRPSMIPEDPGLVTLVITKESVYSAITNLVTAVRALTGTQTQEENKEEKALKDDFSHLCLCCECVVRTTNECAACIRACLHFEKEGDYHHHQQQQISIRPMQESNKPEALTETHSSALGRKVASLQAIQQHQEEQLVVPEKSNEEEVESLAVNENITVVSPLVERSTVKNDQSLEVQKLPKEPMPMPDTDSVKQGPIPIPEIIVPERSKLRARAVSISHAQPSQRPSLPPKNDFDLKPSVSAALPMASTASTSQISLQELAKSPPKDQLLKSRRSRGLSVSSLRSSLHKNKSERISKSASNGNLPESSKSQMLPSWMSLGSSTQEKSGNNSIVDVTPSPPTAALQQLSEKEPEYEFLKQPSLDEDEMIFNIDGEVTGATIEALVQKLTSHEKSPDLLFTRAFFYGFRLFTNPATFVKLLVDRFTLSPPTKPQPLTEEQLMLWTNRVLIPVRLRVYNVIKTWMETYFSYEQDGGVENFLMEFVSVDMVKVMPGPAKRMVDLIKKTFASKGSNYAGRKQTYHESRIIMQKSTSTTVHNSAQSSNGSIFSNLLFDDHHLDTPNEKLPTTVLGKSLKNQLRKAISQNNLASIHVYDIDSLELARQLTLMENSLFIQIRPNEMIGQEFKKKVGTSQAIHVKAMIQRSTQITSWISDTILSEADTKKRAQVLKYWIKVGDACLQLNNYNTLMAIRSALDSTSIARLKKTWDYLSMKYKLMWEPIYRATDSQRNFAEYRQRLKTTVAPCLPFLGVYLTDMTFIDDGNADRRMSPNGRSLINFDKYIKITRVLNEIDQFQIPYRLSEVEEIQKYLIKTLETVEQDDQVYYDKSLMREPKEEESF